jgi:hypothetical protein
VSPFLRVNDRPCAEVRVWPGEQTFVLGRMARGQTIAPGGAIVHLLNVFSTLERVSANDRPRGANVRFLNVYSTIEETSTNDHPNRCDRSLPQCVISHCARIKLKKNQKSKNQNQNKRKERNYVK